MSDNMYLNSRVAPHVLKYSNMTPLSFQSTSSKRVYWTSNQSSYSGANNIIRIPISSGTSLLDSANSFLKFDYVNNEGNASGITHQFSGSAASLIYRLRVISDNTGQDLENILFYNHCAVMCADLMLSPAQRASRFEQGFGAYGVVPQLAANVDNGAAVGAVVLAVQQLTSARTNEYGSKYLGADEMIIPATTANSANMQTICLPLDLSSILGASAKKLIPLFLTSGITLEITIDPYPVSSSAQTQPNFLLQNVGYHAQLIDFQSDINVKLTEMVQTSGLFMHGTSWTNILTQLGDGVKSWMISERLRSVKSVFWSFNDARKGVAWFDPLNRQSNKLSNYQVKIGSQYFPPARITCRTNASDPKSNGEVLVELNKAIAEYSNSYHAGLINSYNFGVDLNPDTVTAIALANSGITAAQAYQNISGRAAYGLDLDAFGRSDCESGVNMILNNPLTVNFEQSAGYGQVLNAFTYLLHDVVYTIDPSGAYSVSK